MSTECRKPKAKTDKFVESDNKKPKMWKAIRDPGPNIQHKINGF